MASGITQTQLWAALGLSGLTVGALLGALNQVRRLFDGFRTGEVLTPAAASRISAIGRWLVALALLTVVVSAGQSVLLSLAAPAGQRQLAVGLTQSEIGFLLAGGLLTLIGWAMGEAAAVAEENRGFV